MLHKIQSFFHSSIHRLKFFCILLVLPCLALECNPDKDEEEKPTYYMSEEFKDYVLFPEGSWWVYENQRGQTDTLKIIWQEKKVINSRKFSSKVEGFQHHLYSSYFKDTLFGGGQAPFGGEGQIGYNRGLKYNTSYQFFTAKDTGDTYYYNSKEAKYIREIDTFCIKKIVYKDVKVFKTFQKKYPQQPKRIYWAKDVGIIKKVLFDSTVWKLKNYHINN